MGEEIMNIDFIKWMVGYAEGFDLYNNGDDMFSDWVLYHNGYEADPLAGDFHKTAQAQLLLQRAVEGVNREGGKGWFFCMDCEDIIAYEYGNYPDRKYFKPINYFNIDQAKEKALMYIWEQK